MEGGKAGEPKIFWKGAAEKVWGAAVPKTPTFTPRFVWTLHQISNIIISKHEQLVAEVE